MKQECPTYRKSIVKSKALATTLSDMESKANFDESVEDGIMSAFTATIESPKEAVGLIDEEEELIESKFKKMGEQDDIHIAYSMLYKVSEKHDKLYIWLRESSVKWSWNVRNSPPRLMKLIKPLEY